MAKNEVRVTIVGEDKLSPAVKSADSTLGGFGSSIKGKITDVIGDLGQKFPIVGKAAGAMGMDIAGIAGPAAAAGAAIVGAGAVLKGLGDEFANTALDAKKMADATGLSVGAASEWTAAADDVGISTDQLAGAFGKATKALGTTPQKFADLGVEIIRTKDGTVDMNATLLSAIGTIDAIQDPTKKAALASQLFGKSWQELTPLLDKGADQLRETMAATSDAQRITEGEVSSAQDWQAAMDNLGDVSTDLKLSLGKLVVEGFVPLIEKIAEAGNDFSWFVGKTSDMTGGLVDIGEAAAFAWENFTPPGQVGRALGLARTGVEDLGDAWNSLTDSGDPAVTVLHDTTDATSMYSRTLANATSRVEDHKAAEEAAKQVEADHAAAIKETTKRLEAQAKALDDAVKAQEAKTNAALGAINSELGYHQAVSGVEDALITYQAASVASAKAAKDHGASSDEAAAAARDLDKASDSLQGSILTAASAAAQYAQDQATAAGRTFTAADSVAAQKQALEELKQKFPELGPGIDAFIAKLDAIPTDKSVDVHAHAEGLQEIIDQLNRINSKTITVTVDGHVHVGGAGQASGGDVRAAASGADAMGGAFWVGEQGPELFVPGSDGHIFPANSKFGGGGGGGGVVYNITVNMPPGSDGDDVVKAIRRYERRNGSGWRAA